ncbi:M1 family metallopeptidase [soil metagenome]
MIARSVVLVGMVTLTAMLAAQGRQPPAEQPAAPPPASQPAPEARPLSPRNASYEIAATLDPGTHALSAWQTLTWRNISSAPTTTLQFHLYYNAWRNTRSTWMRDRQLAGQTALAARPEGDWGWIDVTRLSVDGGPDVVDRLRFIAPDDGNPDDRTVVELPLDRAVGPGETITVRMDWGSRVPRTFARTGRIGNVYFLAHWFPKIGVLEDAGWNTRQFHGHTEFFSHFGVYDVRLTVPTAWTVGATGVEQSRRDLGNGLTTHHYYQADVHDFAWTTSPDYVEHREPFEEPGLPPVEMRLLMQPEHEGQAGRHFEATRAALKHYGEWFGPYPYEQITIVDPAWQSGAGGMEYPTLFTAGTRWLAPRNATQPESVTVHEAGHQFFYGIVANNEVDHAWLDEGLNTFAQARTLDVAFEPNYYTRRYFGGFIPWVFRDLRLHRDADGNRLHAYRPLARQDAQATPTWQYWPGSASAISYNKTALWLHTLERMIGWDALQRAMATYFERWAFRHPTPDDFFAVINEVAGQDLGWFFDQVHRGSNVFDYGIDTFRSERNTGRGLFGEAGARQFIAADARDGYRTAVVVRRYGEGEFPVDVRVVFADGEEVRERWDGRERWRLFEYQRASQAVTAQVDPERVLLLDVNLTNNSATLEPRAPEAARKWSLAWLIWLQDHLLTYGFFV